MSNPVDGRPLDRPKRAAINSIIGMDWIRDPCDITSPSSGSPDCNNGDSVRLAAKLTRGSLESLQKKLGPSVCSGMTLDTPINMPSISADMPREEKLRQIYTSLVHHMAHVQVIAKQKEGSTMHSDYQNSVTKLKNLHCSLSCTVGMSAAETEAIVSAAGSIDVAASPDSSSQILRDCLIVGSTITLLDMLITLVQG